MAKNCEICGKSLGLVAKGTVVTALDERFEGYNGRTACTDCGYSIETAQSIVKNGPDASTDLDFYLYNGKEILKKVMEETSDEVLKEALQNLLEETKNTIKNPDKVKSNTKEKDLSIDFDIYGTPVMQVEGCRGRRLYVYEDYVVIKTSVTIGSVITGNATDGEKAIFYKDCVGVQFKTPGIAIGYLQLETASGQMNNLASNMFAENTFTFDMVTQAETKKAYKYIFDRMKDIKTKTEK